ncbi:MAG: MBL fold metallo-hydrolase [Lachnospiraceae bacterium]|nr:MBL fold metallo-hydrolase [Lachnospiraceae bacterium]
MLKIGRIVMGSVETNCYFVYEEGKNKILVFDPADGGEYLYRSFQEKGFEVAAILLTHAHFDHILGCDELRRLTGAKVYAWEKEEPICKDPAMNVSQMFGKPATVKVDEFLKDGARLTIEGMELQLIGTPGHTCGSCCYYFEKDGLLISGDTLFEGSVGRTDFPTGSGATLSRSLKEKLMVLPEEVQVFPGHGGFTTIGDEKKYNPFCA